MRPNNVYEAGRRARSLAQLHRQLSAILPIVRADLGITPAMMTDLSYAVDDADDVEVDMRRRLDARAARRA